MIIMPRGKFNFKIVPDENFSKIIGKEPLYPHEMIKAIWNYIKENNLMVKD